MQRADRAHRTSQRGSELGRPLTRPAGLRYWLGVPAAEVWTGLREFVPSVLRLADGSRAVEA